MLLGIDVGGTFTDAVLVEEERIIATAKQRTTHENIAEGLLQALGIVMQSCPDPGQIMRVAISTTLITNAVTTGKLPEVQICALPGPGLNCSDAFPVPPLILPGYTDHRGKLVAPTAYDKQLQKLKANLPLVISAKFSTRNPQSELELAKMLAANGQKDITMGHEMSGQLGFIRRTNSAYYTAASSKLFENFIRTVRQGLDARQITAPLYVLKADGGTLPAAWLEKHTVEAYFTGPAASVMGIKALVNPAQNCISLDIGGTTTDIAFWQATKPLYAKRGTNINGYPTSVRALHLRSLGVGGDSFVQRVDGRIQVGPQRLGPAMALGGSQPTLSDAFVLLGYDDFGERSKAEQAMQAIACNGQTASQAAQEVLQAAASKIISAIKEMLAEYALQPVYRVEDIVNAQPFTPELLIGVGGAARGVVPRVAQLLELGYQIPQSAFVANAVGAAVARATLLADLHADTALGEGILPQSGQKHKLSKGFSVGEAKQILSAWLQQQADELGLAYDGSEVVWQEEFPVIRDSWRSGSIINLSMQLKPGVLFAVKGEECSCTL